MIINNIVQNPNPKVTAIKYYIQWQGGSNSGTVYNQRYTEVHPTIPCDIAIVGDPITFTVELQGITTDKICLTAYWENTMQVMQVDQTVLQGASETAKK